MQSNLCTYNDNSWDPKIVAIVDKRSLFRGHITKKNKIQNGTQKRWQVLVILSLRFGFCTFLLFLPESEESVVVPFNRTVCRKVGDDG